jgi:hypothetical protein
MFVERVNTQRKENRSNLLLPKTGPLFIISNHPFSIRLLTTIIHTSQAVRPDLAVVLNSAFAPYVEKFGVDVIPVDCKKPEPNGHFARDMWAEGLHLSKSLTTDSAVPSRSLVADMAVERLRSRRAVWITPAAARDISGRVKWQNGVGRIITDMKGEDLTVALVYVPYKITQSPKTLKLMHVSALYDTGILTSDNSIREATDNLHTFYNASIE